MKKLMIMFFALSLTVSAHKIDLSKFKEKVILEGQEIFIGKAEIIVNKMPTIGGGKNRNYIIISLKTGDGKKVKAKYSMEKVFFHNGHQKGSYDIKEKRVDS